MVNRPLEGFRVVEVASWMMVPASAGILAEWGADVIKIEHPVSGDPMRGLMTPTRGTARANLTFHHGNRSKRSVGLDISAPAGRELLMKLVDTADVFITNFLPAVRGRLEIDAGHIHARNPRVVYARGSAVGPSGPEKDRPGYDYSTFWARSGVGHAMHAPEMPGQPEMPWGGLGDVTTAGILAGGVAAALLQRERTGAGTVVDASLLATGVWMTGARIAAYSAGHYEVITSNAHRTERPNPLVNMFQTSDNRYIALTPMQERDWPELCARMGRPELAEDSRYASLAARRQHGTELVSLLEAMFARHTLAEWRERFEGMRCVWEPVQDIPEVVADRQVSANGYVLKLEEGAEHAADAPQAVASAPVKFGEAAGEARAAPEHGANTEEVLLELGISWQEIEQLKADNVII